MTFYETVTAAVRDLTLYGYDSPVRLEHWLTELRKAALATMWSPVKAREELHRSLHAIYDRLVIKGGVAKFHVGVPHYTVERLFPLMRQELDRWILASADLIKLNREEAISKTLRRFSGWATSIPAGGSKVVDKPEVKDDVAKALRRLPYSERFVAIDQGHKLTASINAVIANNGGAIAGEWFSNYLQRGYDYREDHKERHGKFYLIRGNWAQEKGLVKPGAAGYLDKITQAGEEPGCRCHIRYVYVLSRLPVEMLTQKGIDALAEIKRGSHGQSVAA